MLLACPRCIESRLSSMTARTTKQKISSKILSPKTHTTPPAPTHTKKIDGQHGWIFCWTDEKNIYF
jgi:hypothetical protein